MRTAQATAAGELTEAKPPPPPPRYRLGRGFFMFVLFHIFGYIQFAPIFLLLVFSTFYQLFRA
jgi:hypothetical protein